MCTVNIKVDVSVIRSINPALTSIESIERWLQNQVNFMIQDQIENKSESREFTHNVTVEELYGAIEKDITEIYADL